MATALRGSGGLPAINAEARHLHRAAHGLSLPQRRRLHDFSKHSIVARSGAAGAIPALISPLEPTSLPLIDTAKLYLALFGAGVLAYFLLGSEEEVRIITTVPQMLPLCVLRSYQSVYYTYTESIPAGLT